MRAGTLIAALLLAGGAGAQTLPAPAVTIYPREIIRDDMLEEIEPAYRLAGQGALAESRAALVGKSARITLPRGRPIPLSAIEEPRIVANGGAVRLVFRVGGVTILARGVALQAAGAGERVRVRNSDSSLIVSGIVLPDGGVEVSQE